MTVTGYQPPPYPYDRLNSFRVHGERFEGGLVDLSIGTPRDPLPDVIAQAFAASTDTAIGYPPSVGSAMLLESARNWFSRRFGVTIAEGEIATCVGSKEFVASLPQLARMRRPDRDTVLYPAVSYPTYDMGATLAGCRGVPVPVDSNWRMDLSAIDPADAARAVCLWSNSPGNPAGALEPLEEHAAWGRANDVLVVSDECYIEFTWANAPSSAQRQTGAAGKSILSSGTSGVLALHSLSKRSNFAGGRIGVYAGDPEWVHYLSEMRKHTGMMAPGPSQAAAIAAFDDDAHVDAMAETYLDRLTYFSGVLKAWGLDAPVPEGGFYLWIPVPEGQGCWDLAERLATEAGVLVSPGEFYGPDGAGFVRAALVEPRARLENVAARLGVS